MKFGMTRWNLDLAYPKPWLPMHSSLKFFVTFWTSLPNHFIISSAWLSPSNHFFFVSSL